jgi:hypothetical protein
MRGGVRALVRSCAQRVADNNAGDSVQRVVGDMQQTSCEGGKDRVQQTMRNR